ncbi:MAG: phenylalanine--tRNA ligase subunit beta, partial [Candidatus Aminicenantes bacterium]|nr:phenylalanine--tRNA ligase subunit beta [Candidatus Aminicenantes bacterium]
MKINLEYLKRFVAFDLDEGALRELLAGIGLETAETLQVDGQTVLDLETTPNRPDWLSHTGIAREIAAKDETLHLQDIDVVDVDLLPGGRGFAIHVEDPGDCRRYSGCIVRDVTVKDSEPAVQRLLVSLGLRPINDIVDISNMVMMTCGQPLHIFDLERLQGGQVRVRRARRGETLQLLDERQVELDENLLLIADASRPLALAGIMGGLESGIQAGTRHVFIESACFDPVVIRRGARQLGLMTDASYRFERGMDVEATVPAMKMALHLLSRSQGRRLTPVFFQDAYPRPLPRAAIRLDKGYPERLTGIAIAAETSAAILGRLGFTLRDEGGHWQVEPPSWRVDVEGKQDLVEEIIRIYGYGHLRGQMPLTANPCPRLDAERAAIQSLKCQLVGSGFNEVINYVFQGPEENLMADPQDEPLVLKNPLGKDFSVMKNSLLAGLLKNTAANANQSMERIALFEIGKVFGRRPQGMFEEPRLALSVHGRRQKKDWRLPEQEFDFPWFKSLLRLLGRRLRLELTFRRAEHPAYAAGCCFALEADGRRIGVSGEVAPAFCRHYKLDKPVYAAELEIPALVARAGESRFRMWGRFPAVRRDFTFLMAKDVSYEELSAGIEGLRPDALESYELT